MGCTSSKQTSAMAGPGVTATAPASGAASTLLQNQPVAGKVHAAEIGRFAANAAIATATKKVAKVADSKVYSMAMQSVAAVETAPTSRRQEAWAVCDAAWARALEKGKKAETAWPELPRLESEEEAAVQEKRENAAELLACERELSEGHFDLYQQIPPSNTNRRVTVLPGPGGIACDVDDEDLYEPAKMDVEDASGQLRISQPAPLLASAKFLEEDSETGDKIQNGVESSVFGLSLFACCAPPRVTESDIEFETVSQEQRAHR
eukprot:TRINITY_DN13235_c0_g1_i1.p1 TRINITY_DN13235_c0_g1~~TRINITY_DN13235_c0_g1_i1.p1  ORF type:complete len:286 (+),score=63.83 TRINITY_DN13235_c0_g1_i1:71-859(+)